MDMKIDSLKIKQRREARGWSQEHLAEVAGLSPRTVQRIEAEGNASPESRMALAAALGVDAAELGPAQASSPAMSAPVATPLPEGRKGDWRRHATLFLIVCTGLVLFDIFDHSTVTWSKWPVLGWGIGLLMHWLRQRTAPAES